MGEVAESIQIRATLAEIWDHYFKPEGWASWVDGFGRVVEQDSDYPEERSALVWDSTPSGRGRVRERVLEHTPRHHHRIAYSDGYSSGEQATSFELTGDGVEVRIELAYRPANPGIFGPLTDRFFMRGPQARSLRTTLERLRREVEENAAAAEPG